MHLITHVCDPLDYDLLEQEQALTDEFILKHSLPPGGLDFNIISGNDLGY